MLSIPLRAYAFLLRSGEIDVTVHRDLGGVVSLWKEAQALDSESTMLIHVGFNRHDTNTVRPLLERCPGRVLLSEPVRWCLPPGMSDEETHTTAVLLLDNYPLPFYLATSGWGYNIDSPKRAQSVRSQSDRSAEEKWIAALRERHPELVGMIDEMGISTDRIYLEKRHGIPVAARDPIDDFRFEWLLDGVDQSDPFALLSIAPEWLLHFPLTEQSNLTVRLRNAFVKSGMETFGDLAVLNEAVVMNIENFGRRSYDTLAPGILATARQKPYRYLSYSREHAVNVPVRFPVQGAEQTSGRDSRPERESSPELWAPTVEVQYRSLWDGVRALLSELQPRDRFVLEERLGRESSPKTLEEIGTLLGVSRERARQLERRALNEISATSWSGAVADRLGRLLSGREEPLFLDLLEAEDPWFSGFEDQLPFLGCMIERLNEGRLHVWRLDGRLIVTRMREADWQGLQRSTRAALDAQISAKLSPSEVSLFIEGAAVSAQCPELADILARDLTEFLQFASDSSTGTEVLVEVGRSIRAVVAAIMIETDEPLELRTIAARCTERLGEQPSDMALRTALSTVGALPFSGRRYALERHLRLSDVASREILTILEQALAEGATEKQWHCSELLAVLLDQHPDLATDVDAYVINFVLRRSAVAKYLGRLVWVLNTSGATSARDRLDIADLTTAVLTRAGRPLALAELRAEISAVRGLNTIYPVFPSEQIARVAPGVWGLVERDFGHSEEERRLRFAQMERALERRQKALHVSEIAETLMTAGWHVPTGVSNDMIFGLCQIDPRFWFGHGQLIGLASWANLNRHTVRSAIHHAAQEQGSVVVGNLLYERVDVLVERATERYIVRAEMKNLGYVADEQTDVWYLENGGEDVGDESD